MAATIAIQTQSAGAQVASTKPPAAATEFGTMLAQLTGHASNHDVQQAAPPLSDEQTAPSRPSHPALTPSAHKESAEAEDTEKAQLASKTKAEPPGAALKTIDPAIIPGQTPYTVPVANQAETAAPTDKAFATDKSQADGGIALRGLESAMQREGMKTRDDTAATGVVPGASQASQQSSSSDDDDTEVSSVRPTASPKSGGARKGMTAESAASKPGALIEALPVQTADAGIAPAQIASTENELGTSFVLAEAPKIAANGDDARVQTGSDVSSAMPPQPAAQLSHALASIHTGQDGTSQIRIVLNPAELGSVQLSITRSHDGASSVSLAVERPETLRSLQNDLNHLHQALDRAGLPEQRSLVLHLASAEATSSISHGGGPDRHGAAADGSGQNAQQDNNHSRTAQQGRGGQNDHEPEEADSATVSSVTAWRRAGINITA